MTLASSIWLEVPQMQKDTEHIPTHEQEERPTKEKYTYAELLDLQGRVMLVVRNQKKEIIKRFLKVSVINKRVLIVVYEVTCVCACVCVCV
jgi:hypothetical protein